MSATMPGQILGTPGGSLQGAAWAANATVATIGARGEERTALVLDALARRRGGPSVLHDLRIPIPGFSANIDHAIVSGTQVYLFDSKVWKPGFYWTLSGVTRRGWQKFPHADKKTMAMAFEHVGRFLAKHAPVAHLNLPELIVWPSSRTGTVHTTFLTTPGARATSGQRLAARTSSRKMRRPADPQVLAALARLLN